MMQFPLPIVVLAFRQLGSVFVNPKGILRPRLGISCNMRKRHAGKVSFRLDSELAQI